MVLALGTTSAYGAIGWAGQIWPTSGQTYLPTDNIGAFMCKSGKMAVQVRAVPVLVLPDGFTTRRLRMCYMTQ